MSDDLVPPGIVQPMMKEIDAVYYFIYFSSINGSIRIGFSIAGCQSGLRALDCPNVMH